MFIDTHAHLYLEQFDDDIDFIVEICEEEGVNHIYLPNVDSHTYDSMMNLVAEYPEMMHPMIGVHPCSIKENYKEELAFAEKMLKENDFENFIVERTKLLYKQIEKLCNSLNKQD